MNMRFEGYSVHAARARDFCCVLATQYHGVNFPHGIYEGCVELLKEENVTQDVLLNMLKELEQQR